MSKASVQRYVRVNKILPVSFRNSEAERIKKYAINMSRFIRNVILDKIDQLEKEDVKREDIYSKGYVKNHER